MNYLVHLYLSGADPELQLGGLMGDFVKGPIPTSYPEKVALGIHLHRRIDSLAQNSPHTRQSRQRLDCKFGHGRGIIVDIFYDHFLAANWSDYATEPLASYAKKVYRLLQEQHAQLPAGLQQVAPRMIEHNWLVSYRQRWVVGRALKRIAQRLSRPLPLAEGVDDLAAHEALFLHDFKGFMTEAMDFVKDEFDIKVR
ncbi:MAG: acyl carrier protein phosphodiesterase [Desulfuromonadales bacterium]|nr:acyl carrier protein phosphodiesterase [Desulfuromonadales bacterium]